MRIFRIPIALGSTLFFSPTLGCGGATPTTETARPSGDAIDPSTFLMTYAAPSIAILQPPSETIEELEARRGDARGDARRQVLRDLVRAHLAQTEVSDGRQKRRHRADAQRLADTASTGSRDARLLAEMSFAQLWLAFRGDERGAKARAERFTTRFTNAGELTTVAWIIRGDLAFASQSWQEAATAYRYVLGQLGHPLYPYALYRTAACWRQEGREEEARDALREITLLGCSADASEPTKIVAAQAASDLGVGMRQVGSRSVPSSCPEEPEGTTPASRRSIDDERPPGMH